MSPFNAWGTFLQSFGVRISENSGRLEVLVSPGIGKFPIVDASGKLIGTVYGLLLNSWSGPDVKVAKSRVEALTRIDGPEDFEVRVLDQLSGVFLVVTEGVIGRRLYPDVGSSIPIVYAPELRRVGASANDVLDDVEYRDRFLPGRVRRMIAKEGSNGWISGTLTAHRGVNRLLMNHYLDLDSFVATRFWPRKGEIQLNLNVGQAAAIAARDLSGYIEACAKEFTVACTLTAGFDSRMLLAASRKISKEITFVTLGSPGDGMDQEVAGRICRKLGLKHRFYPIKEASQPEEEQWDRLVGHAVREVNRSIHPTLAQIPEDLLLTGLFGETGRARFYRHDQTTINDYPAEAEFISSRLTLPFDQDHIDSINEWLLPIVDMPRSVVLDLAFLELKLSSWAISQGSVQKSLKMAMMPFAQRSIIRAFMSVPPLEQGREALFRELGILLWPDAMEFPINKYGDWRDKYSLIYKITNIGKIKRTLRDRLAGAKFPRLRNN